ncbi:hypothetical protein ACVWYF_003363 [Hymenobacter sp. UYAg731]
MKQLLQLAPLVLCLAACQSNPTVPTATNATVPVPTQPAPAQEEATNPEHIDPNIVIVIGLPDEELTTKQLTRQLGRPDRIAKGAVECGSRLDGLPMGSPDGDMWYYGKTMYEVSGTQAILSSFDVTSGKFQGKLGKLVLNQNTTLEDVRRFFPEAAKEADKPAGPGRSGEIMSLPFYDKDVPQDGALELQFQNGRLQAVEFFSPC